MSGEMQSVLGSAGSGIHDFTRQKVMGLFRFVASLHQRRMPLERQITGWKLRVASLPRTNACVSIDANELELEGNELESAQLATVLLRVSRPQLSQPPEPPAELVAWMTADWRDARSLAPEFHEARSELVENTKSNVTRTVIHPFEEDPIRVELGRRYREAWNAWAVTERSALVAEDVYQSVYQVYNTLQREGERYELVLGDGILVWGRKDGGVCYPLLTRRVRLELHAELQEFRFCDDAEQTDFATSLFRSMDDVDGRTIASLRSSVKELQLLPLGGEVVDRFLAAAAQRLSSQGQFVGSEPSGAEREYPIIARDATYFLRPRSQGVAAALETIIEAIGQGSPIPASILSIVGDYDAIARAQEAQLDRVYEPLIDANEDPEILFTKPGNAEQLSIARKLDYSDSVLVQGPPGTGKTHTIANLLGHLLAQGKSVLVTSHSTKALHVLREKVVTSLQPLCLSVLNDSQRDTAELESSVAAIAQRLNSADAEMLASDATRLYAERDEILAQIRELRRQLLVVRLHEQLPLVVVGAEYRPIEAAKLVAERNGLDSWIPGPIPLDVSLPLTQAELAALYRSNQTISLQDEGYLDRWIPELEGLPTPSMFQAWVNERSRLHALALEEGRQLWSDGGRSSANLAELDRVQWQVQDALATLHEQALWTRSIAENGHLPAAVEIWRGLIDEILATQALVHESAPLLSEHTPVLAKHEDIEHLAVIYREIVADVEETEKAPGFFILLLHPRWKKALADSKVNGDAKPERLEHFVALETAARVAQARSALVRRWNALVVPLGGPSLELEGVTATGQRLEPEAEAKKYIALLERALSWRVEKWEVLQKALTDVGFVWQSFQEILDLGYVALTDIGRIEQGLQEVLPKALTLERARRCDIALDRKFDEAREFAQPKWRSAKVTLQIVNALQAEDYEAYREAYAEVERLAQVARAAKERTEYLALLEVDAPSWAQQIRSRYDLHGAEVPPGDAQAAWLWRQLHDELLRRDQMSIEGLLSEIEVLRLRLMETTTQLVDRLAWGAQLRSTTPEQHQALQGFVAAKKKIGKGTGKNVQLYRALAKEQMVKCRYAVPVWIMPLVSVAETVRADAGVFDVVIIDEASQSDVTGLFALYLGKKVIVVGDAQQVSPLDVGAQVEATNQLVDLYLQGIPNQQLYDGKLSLYDLAEQSFGAMVPLREHFRCAPEIIAFSNRFYDGAIKPLREHGAYAQAVIHQQINTKRGVDNYVNEDEARTIASLIAAMCELPEYAENSDFQPVTFGVISLLGDAQAPRIEQLLRVLLTSAEIERRKIRVGNPAHFQGDERNVILLSMVQTSNGEPLRMNEAQLQRQRYNVAVSRAQDQLWVVHSLDHLRELKTGDLRRQLIEHALNPAAALELSEGAKKNAESPFEQDVIGYLVAAGFGQSLSVQHRVGAYRIDIVITGDNGNRLAVECDGDRWHRPEDLERDMARQADLERLGWRFVRIRGSVFYRNPQAALAPLFERLRKNEILPRHREKPPIDEDDLIERVRARARTLHKQLNDYNLAQPQPQRKIRKRFG